MHARNQLGRNLIEFSDAAGGWHSFEDREATHLACAKYPHAEDTISTLPIISYWETSSVDIRLDPHH